MKKILKIMAIVLIVAVVGLGIYAAASFNPLVPVSNPPIFRAAYTVEKTKYEYDEANPEADNQLEAALNCLKEK